jgi:hypothetical protein
MSTRWRNLTIFGAALAFLLILAASLSSLDLKPGQTFNIQRVNQSPGAEWLPINVDIWPVIFQALLIIFVLTLPFYIIYMMIDAKRRKRLLINLFGAALMILGLSMIRQALINRDLKGQESSAPLAIPTGYPQPLGTPVTFTANPADHLVTIAALLLGGLGVVIAFMAWYFIAGRRRISMDPAQLLAVQAEETIEDLLAGKNLRETILLCYRRMTEIVAKNRNLPRDVSVTSHEFEQLLVTNGLPAAPVHDLTQVFEDIRYGDQNAGEEERRRAVSALRIIASVCRAPEPAL